MQTQAIWQAVSSLRGSLRERKADILIAHGELVENLGKLRTLARVLAFIWIGKHSQADKRGLLFTSVSPNSIPVTNHSSLAL